jgi:hypothetical protein
MDDKLVRRQADHSALSTLSLTPSENALAREIHITRVNAKAEPDEFMDQELVRVLSGQPVEAIEWAFRTWRDGSPFVPAICEINELIQSWHRQKRQLEEEDKARLEKLATSAARERGEVVTWPQVLERFAEMTGKTSQEAFEETAKPMPKAPLDVETWDPQQLRQTKEARKADLAAWKERQSK